MQQLQQDAMHVQEERHRSVGRLKPKVDGKDRDGFLLGRRIDPPPPKDIVHLHRYWLPTLSHSLLMSPRASRLYLSVVSL